jgi:hypothetical protein
MSDSIEKFIHLRKRFSATSVSRGLHIDLLSAYEICEIISSNNNSIEKWFSIVCPEDICRTSVYGNKFELIDELKVATCERCGNKFHVDDSNIHIYYLNKAVSRRSI